MLSRHILFIPHGGLDIQRPAAMLQRKPLPLVDDAASRRKRTDKPSYK